MKLFTAAVMGLGLLCHSSLAIAAGPIPFSELVSSAGIHPAAIPVPQAGSGQTEASAQPAQTTPLSSGQKALIGTGIALAGVGVALIAFGASVNSHDIGGSSIREAGFGAGAGAAGIGVVLIAFGAHHHKTK